MHPVFGSGLLSLLAAAPSPATVSCAVTGASVLEPLTPAIGLYDVFERTLAYPTAGLANPWENVSVSAEFESPSGKVLSVDGFYYDADTFKVRFTPAELGRYDYTIRLAGPSGPRAIVGAFTSVVSSNHGFLRPHASNPYRLVFEDGSIANAIGLNDCWNPTTGVLFGYIGANQQVGLDAYMATYGDQGARMNVFRWNPGNCSFDIYGNIAAAGNTYRVPEGKLGDQLLAAAHAHGFHVVFTFFRQPPDPTQPTLVRPTKDAIRYVMARYGPFVDAWELTNESTTATVPLSWVAQFSDYVRSVDPYRRLVLNSYPQPGDWNALDARSPHITLTQDGYQDQLLWTNGFSSGTPVLAGELYNPGNHNWDPLSATRLRVYAWTAFFGGLVDVYWNTSYSTSCNCTPGNMYLGPEERGSIEQLQRITHAFDPDVVPSVVAAAPGPATAYGLRSATMLAVYVYRPLGQTAPFTTSMTLDVPVQGHAVWIDPATGTDLQHFAVQSGWHLFTTPPFVQDVLLLVD